MFLFLIKLEEFDIDNILIDEKLHENISIYNFSYKIFILKKNFNIILNKIYVLYIILLWN